MNKQTQATDNDLGTLAENARSFRRKRDPQNGADISWLQSVTQGAGLISSFWVALRVHGCAQKGK